MYERSQHPTALSSRLLPRLRRRVYRLASSIDRAVGATCIAPFILCYHSVAQSGWRFAVPLRDLRQQMALLTHGYAPITAYQLEAFLRGLEPLAPSSFLLTFDDGYRDLIQAEPLMSDLGIRPLLFMVSDPDRAVGAHLPAGSELLGDDELRSLSAAGWEIGSHSASHADLPNLADDALRREISGSKQRLETVLGKPVRYFAYPKGRYSLRVMQACRAAGYAAAFSMDDGFLSTATELFRIPRVGVDGTHTLAEIKTLISPSAVRFRKVLKRSVLGRFV